VFTVFSFVVSNFGLSNIISYSLPMLMFLYPLAITLILLALTGKFFDHDRIVYLCVTVFTGIAALFDLCKTLPEALQPAALVALGRKLLPWFDLNMGWVVPAVVGLVLGLLLRKRTGARR